MTGRRVRFESRGGVTMIDYGNPADVRHAVSPMERALVEEVRRQAAELVELRRQLTAELTFARADCDVLQFCLHRLVTGWERERPRGDGVRLRNLDDLFDQARNVLTDPNLVERS